MRAYQYEVSTKSVVHPHHLDVTWPVEYTVSHHPKHQLLSRTTPSPLPLLRAMLQWQNKRRWQRHFELEKIKEAREEVLRAERGLETIEKADETPAAYQAFCRNLRAKTRDTPVCLRQLSTAGESYLDEVLETCTQTIKQNIVKYTKNKTVFSNFDRIFTLGLKILRNSSDGMLPNDKDGGFCSIGKDQIHVEELKILQTDKYRPVPIVEVDFPEIVQTYRDIITSIQEVTNFKDFQSTVFRPLRDFEPANLVSRLDMNVKSHKLDGEVSMRPIHASSKHPFGPGFQFISNVIRDKMKDMPHLLRDSDDFLFKLSSVRMLDGDLFVKVDVKDLFMSGRTQRIANISTSAAPSAVNGKAGFRGLFKDLVSHVMSTQFVSNCQRLRLESVIFNVIIGSGMGLKCSGELSDYAFYILCEVSFLLCPEIRRRFNIRTYFRFKDDMFFIIGGDRDTRKVFYEELKTRAGFFKLKWETIHRTSVDFLDLNIFKGPRWHSTGVLDYFVKVKTSALGIMLSSSSAHHPSVHMTWPKARVSSIRSRCSSKHLANISVNHFTTRLGNHDPLHICLNNIDDRTPAAVRRSSCMRSSWLFFPYHPIWATCGLSRKLDMIFLKWRESLLRAGENIDNLRVRVAWSLGARTLASRIKLCNKR